MIPACHAGRSWPAAPHHSRYRNNVAARSAPTLTILIGAPHNCSIRFTYCCASFGSSSNFRQPEMLPRRCGGDQRDADDEEPAVLADEFWQAAEEHATASVTRAVRWCTRGETVHG
jgi:hypothetical protein